MADRHAAGIPAAPPLTEIQGSRRFFVPGGKEVALHENSIIKASRITSIELYNAGPRALFIVTDQNGAAGETRALLLPRERIQLHHFPRNGAGTARNIVWIRNERSYMAGIGVDAVVVDVTMTGTLEAGA